MAKRYKKIWVRNPKWRPEMENPYYINQRYPKYIEKLIPITDLPWSKTRTGRVVYERKPHLFEWQRVSKICFEIINNDIPPHLRDRHYVRMRSGFLAYYFAMCRMYPGFNADFIKSIIQQGRDDRSAQEFARVWKDYTFKIIDLGLNFIGPEFPGRDHVELFAKLVGDKYYDFLFSLSN